MRVVISDDWDCKDKIEVFDGERTYLIGIPKKPTILQIIKVVRIVVRKLIKKA